MFWCCPERERHLKNFRPMMWFASNGRNNNSAPSRRKQLTGARQPVLLPVRYSEQALERSSEPLRGIRELARPLVRVAGFFLVRQPGPAPEIHPEGRLNGVMTTPISSACIPRETRCRSNEGHKEEGCFFCDIRQKNSPLGIQNKSASESFVWHQPSFVNSRLCVFPHRRLQAEFLR